MTDSGFMNGHAEVTVTGMTPGTAYLVRCRCELADPDVDPEAMWSLPVSVRTLTVADLERREMKLLERAERAEKYTAVAAQARLQPEWVMEHYQVRACASVLLRATMA